MYLTCDVQYSCGFFGHAFHVGVDDSSEFCSSGPAERQRRAAYRWTFYDLIYIDLSFVFYWYLSFIFED